MVRKSYYDYLISSNLSTILTVVYFHRLEINHDSHEFTLEPGTIANRYKYIKNYSYNDTWQSKMEMTFSVPWKGKY